MRERDLYLRVPEERTLGPEGSVGSRTSLQSQIDEMLRFLRRTRYPAVASTQVGVRRRIVAVDLTGSGRGPVVLVDPVLEAVSLETAVEMEGCLSLPGLLVPVRRPVQVRVRALARSGQRVRLDAAGLLARILQHKLDHLEGVQLHDHLPVLARAAALERFRRRGPRCRVPREVTVTESFPHRVAPAVSAGPASSPIDQEA